MRSIRTSLKRRNFRKAVIYFLTYSIIFYTSIPAVMATPTGGAVETGPGLGGADITYNTGTYYNTTQVDVLTESTVINWTSLDTAGGDVDVRETLAFSQGGLTNSAVLNRVSGPQTQFNGDLIADGMRIFIVNPAGVVFGEGSFVNVNQLVASTLGISSTSFADGIFEFIAGEGEIGGISLEALGDQTATINAAEGVALLGKHVQNNGTITVGEGGFVVMAAGDRVLLGESGSNILVELNSVTTDNEADGEVINNGIITAPAGTVALASGDVTAPTETTEIIALGAGDIYSTAIDLPKVSSGVGTVEQNGTINTDGTTDDGGSVALTANDSVILSSGSSTTANAGTDADAGMVVVHSKGQTTIEAGAAIETIGGHEPFNLVGDFDDIVDTTIEITGEQVYLAGDIDASATDGKRGKVVIDAFDITVADGYMPADPPANTVYEKWIESQSDVATDVELMAHAKEGGNITVEHLTDGIIYGGSGDIVMRTKYNTGGILFEAEEGQEPADIITDDGGNVYMLAGAGGISIGDVSTWLKQHDAGEPGKIRISTTDGDGGDITTGSLSVEGGSYDEISVVAKGNLTVNGDISTYAHQVDEELAVYQARTCLVSDQGDVGVVVNGTISLYTQGKYGTTADLHIDSGQNIAINPNGEQITVEAKTVTSGPSNASVKLHAGQNNDPENPATITFDGVNVENIGDVIYLKAQAGGGVGTAEVHSSDNPEDWDEKVNAVFDEETGELIEGAHAKLEIVEEHPGGCEECPVPPGLTPPIDPVGTPDYASTHMGDATSGNVLDNDEPEPGLTLTVISNTDPENGTVTVLSNGDFVYTPNPGFVGEDSFTYIASDGTEPTGEITVIITMWNNSPTPVTDTGSTHMGTPVTINIADLLSNDTDPDGDSVSYDSFSYTGSGSVVDNEDGTLTYTPAAGYVGDDTFTYTVTDPQIDGTPQEATVIISMSNNPPQVNDDTIVTDFTNEINGNVLDNDNDPDNDNLTVVLDGVHPEHGQLVLNLDGTFTYIPDPGYSGSDSFAYLVTDGELDGDSPVTYTGMVWININPFIAAAPLPEEVEFVIAGCPALIQWTAEELGMDEGALQIWITNTVASSRGIQPCDACARLKAAATTLQDIDGTYVAALAQVVNEFASSTAPPSEEQMASIASAIANNTEAGTAYALAGEYLDALVAYVGILNGELDYSAEDSITVATDKYIAPLADENVNLATYVTARLLETGN